jgi:hypothetical protein
MGRSEIGHLMEHRRIVRGPKVMLQDEKLL